MDASVMFARMETGSGDELISSIAPDVMRCLGRCSYFEKLDEHLSPEDNSTPTEKYDGSFRWSETILLACGFDRHALDDIIALLHSQRRMLRLRSPLQCGREEPPESNLLARSSRRTDCEHAAPHTPGPIRYRSLVGRFLR